MHMVFFQICAFFLGRFWQILTYAGPCASPTQRPGRCARMMVFTGNEQLIQSGCCEVEPEFTWKGPELASAGGMQNRNMHSYAFIFSNMQ